MQDLCRGICACRVVPGAAAVAGHPLLRPVVIGSAVMSAEGPCWASLSGPLVEVFCLLGSSTEDLARCSLVCRGWHAVLRSSPAPWVAALVAQYGFVPQTATERQAAHQLLVAARTSTLFLAGQNFLSLPCSKGSRFASPEQLVLVSTQGAHAALSGGGGGSGKAPAVRFTTSPVLRNASLGSTIRVKTVSAGADFAALLTWDGQVLDTRCLPAPGGGGSGMQRRQAQQGTLDWSGTLWRPPCGRAVSIAGGGCWQGNGRPAGHVLVLTDQHTVWGWGGNAAGQLGLGVTSQQEAGPGEPATADLAGRASPASPAAAAAAWVATPMEVVDSMAAAALGLPTAVACGDHHSALLCRSGHVYAAGSNVAGACGLPLVQLQAAAFSEVPLPAGTAVAAVSCGSANTAVVTQGGRLLVCGANELGQAGVGKAGGSCFLLTDVGPSAAWHGMQRANQQSGGGGGEAAAGVAGAACGGGSLYALTDQGEVFSWGQGSQGELALGGSSRNVCTPSRMPWAHDAARLATSCGGRFGAVVDRHGRLFTFGAGKSGALGHGDTAKRAVGRQVKALQGHITQAVACGAEWMLVVASWKAPAGKFNRRGSGSGGSRVSPAGYTLAPAEQAGLEGAALDPTEQLPKCTSSFKYVEVEPGPPPPSPRSPRQRRINGRLSAGIDDGADGGGSNGVRAPPRSAAASIPEAGADSAACSASSRRRGEQQHGQPSSSGIDGAPGLRGRSGREQRREQAAQEQQAGHRRRKGRGRRHGGWEPPDAAPEAAAARRQRRMQEPPAAPSTFSDPRSECDGESTDGEGSSRHSGSASWAMDREMAYLLRRQLKAFSNDPRQRELMFPRSFSVKDRWKVHVMAEAWGLMHESYGDGAQRRVVVWKPSRSRKSLKPAILAAAAAAASSDSDIGGGGATPAGSAPSAAPTSGAREGVGPDPMPGPAVSTPTAADRLAG